MWVSVFDSFVFCVFVCSRVRGAVFELTDLLKFCHFSNMNAKPMTMMGVMVVVDTAAWVTIHFALVKTA